MDLNVLFEVGGEAVQGQIEPARQQLARLVGVERARIGGKCLAHVLADRRLKSFKGFTFASSTQTPMSTILFGTTWNCQYFSAIVEHL